MKTSTCTWSTLMTSQLCVNLSERYVIQLFVVQLQLFLMRRMMMVLSLFALMQTHCLLPWQPGEVNHDLTAAPIGQQTFYTHTHTHLRPWTTSVLLGRVACVFVVVVVVVFVCVCVCSLGSALQFAWRIHDEVFARRGGKLKRKEKGGKSQKTGGRNRKQMWRGRKRKNGSNGREWKGERRKGRYKEVTLRSGKEIKQEREARGTET